MIDAVYVLQSGTLVLFVNDASQRAFAHYTGQDEEVIDLCENVNFYSCSLGETRRILEELGDPSPIAFAISTAIVEALAAEVVDTAERTAEDAADEAAYQTANSMAQLHASTKEAALDAAVDAEESSTSAHYQYVEAEKHMAVLDEISAEQEFHDAMNYDATSAEYAEAAAWADVDIAATLASYETSEHSAVRDAAYKAAHDAFITYISPTREGAAAAAEAAAIAHFDSVCINAAQTVYDNAAKKVLHDPDFGGSLGGKFTNPTDL